MYDKYIVCEEGFRARGDGRTGGVVEVRMPYYRGLTLSMVEAVGLILDGQPIPPHRTTFTVHGNTYSFDELPRVFDDRWEMGERAQLALRPTSRWRQSSTTSPSPFGCASRKCQCRAVPATASGFRWQPSVLIQTGWRTWDDRRVHT